jgi:hypothetical protein
MSHSIQSLSWLDRLGFASRHCSFANKLGRFLRRRFIRGLQAAFWEFMRVCLGEISWLGIPRATFSLYQSLRWGDPMLEGRIVLEDQGVPKISPQSIAVSCGLEQHQEQPWPIVWTKHRNARLVANSLALFNGKKELCLESVYGEARWRDDPASRTLWLPKATYLKGRWTSIVSNWNPLDGSPVYGHWLHDALPRLAILESLPRDTRIIIPPTLKPVFWETLELLGLKDRCRPTSEVHLLVEEYHFSSPTSMITCYNPYAIRWMRSSFLAKACPSFSGPKKFFFVRSGKRRAIENMAEVTDFLASRGWNVIRDMDLSFAQTVKLFSEATDICGFSGSNMCNVMFCPPRCKVLNLVPNIPLDGFVDMIAPVVELDYRAVELEAGGPYAARPRVSIDQIQKGLESAGY